MNKEISQWQFKNGSNVPVDCTTFPFAFRLMYNIVRKGLESGSPVDTSGFIILGPKNPRGERVKYNYNSALEMAKAQDLIKDGFLNGKEFKKKF